MVSKGRELVKNFWGMVSLKNFLESSWYTSFFDAGPLLFLFLQSISHKKCFPFFWHWTICRTKTHVFFSNIFFTIDKKKVKKSFFFPAPEERKKMQKSLTRSFWELFWQNTKWRLGKKRTPPLDTPRNCWASSKKKVLVSSAH